MSLLNTHSFRCLMLCLESATGRFGKNQQRREAALLLFFCFVCFRMQLFTSFRHRVISQSEAVDDSFTFLTVVVASQLDWMRILFLRNIVLLYF